MRLKYASHAVKIILKGIYQHDETMKNQINAVGLTSMTKNANEVSENSVQLLRNQKYAFNAANKPHHNESNSARNWKSLPIL